MFERFTDRARRILVLAQEEARLLNHGFIGTEHILLGLIHEGEGVAARALLSLGVSLEAARQQVQQTIGAGSAPIGSPPFTPRAKKVLELSLREAMQLGQSNIDTEHLLLGLVREGEGVGAQVLVSLGADLGRVRQAVIQLMSGEQARGVVEPPDATGLRARHVRRQPTAAGEPPWLRCALCGRSLWETAHFVVGAGGRACEECVRAAAGLVEHAQPDHRELVLPPKVSGQPPGDEAAAAVAAAVTGAFGPSAGPSTWTTTIEDPGRFTALLQELRERWGRPEAVHVAEIGFVDQHLAFVRFQLELDGGRGTDVSGQLRRHEERWLVTAETLIEVLRRAGVRPDDEPDVVGLPPDDGAVEGVTAAIAKVFGSDRQPGDREDHLEDAQALAPYLQQGAGRFPGRTWVPRVQRIRFTGSDIAEVHFIHRSADLHVSFEGTVRRHGDRWMVTRETMVAILARGGVVVPPPSGDG